MLSTAQHAWSRVRTIVRPFFHYHARWRALVLFVVLITLVLSVNGLNVIISYVNRDFMTALQKSQMDLFWWLGLLYAGMFGVITMVAVFKRFFEERLGLLLREGLTYYLIDRYLANHTYHRLTRRTDIDNPDQRITEDVKAFTATSLSFALILLEATVNFVGFAGVLWSITPLLLLAAMVYALGGTLMTFAVGRRLVGLNILQLKKEADLRFRLIHARENSQSIALQGDEPWEGWRLNDRLHVLVENFKRIINVNRNLGFFTIGFEYLTYLIPIMVVAPLYFRGQVEFGVVSQAMMAFPFVLNAFSVIVKQFQQISVYAANAERLGALVEEMEAEPDKTGPLVLFADDRPRVAFEDLTLWTPDANRLLVQDLSVELPPGRRLLVVGPNGSGKSALFLAAAGIWEWGQGRIIRPRRGDVMFVPQEPFLAPGTLRQQLFEGACCHDLPDERILEVFRTVKFEKIFKRVGGLDAERDWHHALSPGEKRLFAFARLLLAEPPFAFLDASIGGLNEFWVHTLYGALARTRTGYVSIGDHPALRGYHDEVLELDGDGVWRFETCRTAERDSVPAEP